MINTSDYSENSQISLNHPHDNEGTQVITSLSSFHSPPTSPSSFVPSLTCTHNERLTIGGYNDQHSSKELISAFSLSATSHKSLTPSKTIPSNDKFVTIENVSLDGEQQIQEKKGVTSPEFFGGFSHIENAIKQGMNVKTSATHASHGSVAQHSTKTTLSKSISGGDGSIHIKTCFGVLQLSGMKMLSLTSMTLNLIAFIILALIITFSFVGQIMFAHKFDGFDVSSAYYREGMIGACRSAVFSNFTQDISMRYIVKYENFSKLFLANMDDMVTGLPTFMRTTFTSRNMTVNDLKTFKAIAVEQQVISMLKEGNFSRAMQILDSPSYRSNMEAYSEEFQPLTDYLLGLQTFARNFNTIMTTACLVTIVVSFVVVAPTVVASIFVSLKRDTSNSKKLKQVKALLLQDTMHDNKLKNLFKEHCKKEMSLENFSLLDKINDYKTLCEKSFDIQVYLYDSSETSSISDVTSEAGSAMNGSDLNNKKKKKKGYTEKDLREIEKKKFELAFEIHTDYLDVHGDKSVNISKHFAEGVKQQLDFFATTQNEQLPEDLFYTVENEICIVMMDTHMRFKASLENQKQSKKESLKKKILNK
ncbi:hypothetical protein C9374_007604 [Naegleria lovaniensis]|uniref:RGS domain-containing protein n=1 Tax=Naegleria lovaniensis TaxID=51637 RepID=A0AA88GM37_NAELO|nr:uncharacterized protein C9374_007604 [Naegleria lovaniensis]KAG2378966.1 hypothetical protein C9374_007604 [Naegleria lovaniensis]